MTKLPHQSWFKTFASMVGFFAALAWCFSSANAIKNQTDPKSEELSQMKQIAACIAIYAIDNDDLLPPSVGQINWEAFPYPILIQPYCKSVELFHSPFDTISESIGFGSSSAGQVSFGMNLYLMPSYTDGIPLDFGSVETPNNVVLFVSAPQFFTNKNRMGALPPDPCALAGSPKKTAYANGYKTLWMNMGNMVGIASNELGFNSIKPLESLLENKDSFSSWSDDRTGMANADTSARRIKNGKLLISIQSDKNANL